MQYYSFTLSSPCWLVCGVCRVVLGRHMRFPQSQYLYILLGVHSRQEAASSRCRSSYDGVLLHESGDHKCASSSTHSLCALKVGACVCGLYVPCMNLAQHQLLPYRPARDRDASVVHTLLKVWCPCAAS